MLPYEEELMEIIDFNSTEKNVYTNRQVSDILYNMFELSNINSLILGRTLNKISDNYPQAVTIKRNCKGIIYLMQIKNTSKRCM